MYTTHESPERIISRESSYMLVIGFAVTSGYTPAQGDIVKLISAGTLSKVAATTDRPLGYIASAYDRTSGGEVRVACNFKCLMRGEADGTLEPGDEVACSGVDTSGTYNTGNINKFKKAVSGDYIVGVCLVGGLTTTVENQIGIFPNAYLMD